MSQSISLIRSGLDVEETLAEIATHSEAWNQYKLRTESYGTPHTQVSDIWVRYNPWRNFHGNAAAFVLEQHESEWYPVAASIPAVVRLVDQVMQEVGGRELGGVLITKVPPGGEVAPHIDHGWHSRYYEKFAVQLMGNQDQVFWFEDSELRPEPGDLYTFDNSKLHAVYNRSDEDRMTLIICIRR